MAPDILLVEDEPDIAELLQMALRAAGYTVRVAADAHTAYTMLKVYGRPGLSLIDVRLPDGDGSELCRRLVTWWPEHPVILMSATPSLREKGMADGAAEFLAKPFELEELVRVVGRHVTPQAPCQHAS